MAEIRKSLDEVLAPVAERLATVEKMAAPGGPARTRTPQQLHKSAERDIQEARADALEQKAALTTADPELRKGYLEQAADIRRQLETTATPVA